MIGLIDTTILTNIAEALRTQLGVDDRFSPNDIVETLGTGYYKLTPKTSIQNSYNNIGYLQFSFN